MQKQAFYLLRVLWAYLGIQFKCFNFQGHWEKNFQTKKGILRFIIVQAKPLIEEGR